MALSAQQRDAINARLAAYLGVVPGTDYVASQQAMAAVLARLQEDGWQLLRPDRSDIGANWQVEAALMLERSFVLRRTRSAEHQARAEAAGEALGGQDTYESLIVQRQRFSTSSFMRVEGGRAVVDNLLQAAGLAALGAAGFGARPANWVRDA